MTTGPGVEVRGGDELAPSAAATPNLTREVAFETDDALLARVELADGSASGWHSHGDRDAYGVVLEGRARVEYGPGGDDSIEVGAGEFVRLPAGLVHRAVAPEAVPLVALVALVGSGAPVVDADGPTTTAPADPPRVAREDDLVPAGLLRNLTRLTPFPDAPVQQVRGHAAGRVESEWHHHGDNDVLGYVLAGEGYVEWGTGEGERKLARAGDFFRVPAGVVHRDVNPSDDEQDYLLWLTGSEPRVTYVDDPSG
jgi:quercetin dioxygenase-like cupin family protein